MSQKGKKKNAKSSAEKKQNSGMLLPILTGVVGVVLIAALAFFSVVGDKNDVSLTSGTSNENKEASITENEEIKFDENGERKMEGMVKVLVEMEDGSDFTLALYPEYAPKTVENFVKLVNEGFYEGVGFHRVVEGFMAQGGDPEGTGMGGSDETIPGEFASNGFTDNTLSHTRGVISMARSANPDSASSQFFICYDNASFLDGDYAAFGEVIDGMETVDAFLEVERTPNSMGEIASPVTPIVMKKLTVIE